jgi:FKBP-type peptidyl-prolyl cis-trans isomerase FklB
MKFNKLCVLAFLVSGMINVIYGQESGDLKERITNRQLSTKEDSLAYALGVFSYNSWAKDKIYPDPVFFAKAMFDSKAGNMLMTEESARNFLMSYAKELQAKQEQIDKDTFKDYIASNEAFLAKNRERQEITVTPSGLQYEVIKMGTGPAPGRNNTVKVQYRGTLIDGTEFDSSYKRNAAAVFPVSGVIPGWTEALQLMPTGSKFILYIPQNLAYGSKGAGDLIKPYSALIFEVELLDIVK